MKKNISREFRVGLMVITAIFLFYFGFNYLKGTSIFQKNNQYTGYFENLDGLVKQSQVMVKGYKVGQVSDIQYDFTKEKPFTVKIEINDNLSLPVGTTMLLTDDGLLGGKIIELIYASDATSQGAHKRNDILNTSTASGLMSELSGGLMPRLENVLLQADSLLLSLRLLTESPLLDASLISIEKTSADLAASSAQLKLLMQHQMPTLLKDVSGIADDLKGTTENIKNIDFTGIVQNADYTVKNIQVLSEKLNDKENSLGLLLNDKSLYINLNSTAENADKLLIDLKENPKRYVNISVFGGKNK